MWWYRRRLIRSLLALAVVLASACNSPSPSVASPSLTSLAASSSAAPSPSPAQPLSFAPLVISPDARDLVLRAEDVPLGYRLLIERARTIEEIADFSLNEASARQRQFVDGWARAFQHANASTITSKVAIYRRSADAQAELEDARAQSSSVAAPTIGDGSTFHMTNTNIGGIRTVMMSIDFRAGSVSNTLVLQGRPDNVRFDALFYLAGVQLARARRTVPGQP